MDSNRRLIDRMMEFEKRAVITVGGSSFNEFMQSSVDRLPYLIGGHIIRSRMLSKD